MIMIYTEASGAYLLRVVVSLLVTNGNGWIQYTEENMPFKE